MSMRRVAAAVALLVAALAASGGCNEVGDCPAEGAITPGGSCANSGLQCAYELETPSPACDGTTTTIASSCLCTSGTWACPAPLSCGEDGGSAGEDGSASPGDDAGDAASNGAEDAGPG